MASLTAFLGLRKPAATDVVNVVTDIANNMQAIDTHLMQESDRLDNVEADTSDNTYRAGFRNVIRNGDMGIAQRGAGPFTASAINTLDGWKKGHVSGSHTVNRVYAPFGTGLGKDGASGYLESINSGQSAAGDYAYIGTYIEGVRTLAGKQVTLSFLAVATAGTPKIGIEYQQVFGTGGSPSAPILTGVQAVTISTTVTRYSVTFNVASITGKTLGSNGDDYLGIQFWLCAGSNFASRASSIGIQNSTIQITDIQLEQGDNYTLFERIPQQQQLAWCQRYFYRVGDTATPFGSGLAISAGTLRVVHQMPVRMRANPTTNGYNLAAMAIYGTGGGGWNTTGGATPQYYNPQFVTIDWLGGGSNLLNGGSGVVMGAANSFVEFSAEL